MLITVLFLIGTAILAWPQFFRVEQLFPVAQLVAARGLLAAAYVAVAGLAIFLLLFVRAMRRFALSILAVSLLGAAAFGWMVHERGTGPGELLAAKDAGDIRVMTWNTQGENVTVDEIAKLIAEHDVDIVALPETSYGYGLRLADELRSLEHRMWVHHVNIRPEVNNGPIAWQTTVLTAPWLGQYSVIQSSSDGSSNTGQVPSAVVMPVNGVGPIVVAVHAVAPRPGTMDQWREDLRWVADQCPGGNVVLLGDFNATLDHLASLGARGGDMGECRDAASRLEIGEAGTWPAWLPMALATPIDRVMASGVWDPVAGLVIEDAHGSDHRALIVQLRPTEQP
jgi:endonuclease/exonuclease/phosphatase (EEP) superfamily protein YafD